MKINEDLIIGDKETTLGNISDRINSAEILLQPTVLYDGGTTGTNGNITLSDSWQNYRYVEIFYTRAEYEIGSVKAPTDLSLTSNLPVNAICCFYGYGSGFWIGWKQFKFMKDNPKLVTVSYGNGFVTTSGGTFGTGTENTMKCLRILGWK